MSDIGPGDVVQAVEYDCPHCYEDASLCDGTEATIGALYRVELVSPDPPYCDNLYVVGDPNPYCVRGFRKIDAEDTEIARRIRACKPIAQPEKV